MNSHRWHRWLDGLPSQVVHGRPEGQAWLRGMLLALSPEADAVAGNANDQRAAVPRELICIDDAFEHWPLDEPAVHEALAAWLRLPGRRLQWIARDWQAVARRHPRFARWRTTWSHKMSYWAPHDDNEFGRVRGVLGEDWVMERLDAPDWRWHAITNAVQVQAMHNDVADFLQRCEAAWPTTILGL